MKLGAIGTGAMGSAILRGVIDKKVSKRIHFVEVFDDACKWLVADGHIRHKSINDMMKEVDVVLLGVKPESFSDVSDELRESLSDRHTLVSILAGIRLARLRELLGEKGHITRVMPNLAALLGKSMSAVAGDTKEGLDTTRSLFEACGRTVELPESQMDNFTAIAGSGPAYFFLLMAAMEDAAVEMGFTREEGNLMVVQTALGAASLADTSRGIRSPQNWIKSVTCKDGPTSAALNVFEKRGTRQTATDALQAAVKRSVEMSKL